MRRGIRGWKGRIQIYLETSSEGPKTRDLRGLLPVKSSVTYLLVG